MGSPRVEQLAGFRAEHDIGSSTTTSEVDWNDGPKQKIDLDNGATLTFVAPSGVGNLVLRVVQDASNNITWPATVLWPGGTAPTITAGAASVDLFAFYFDGTDYHASFGQDYS